MAIVVAKQLLAITVAWLHHPKYRGTLFINQSCSGMEGSEMTSNVICFMLGTIFPLATVGWLFTH
jgi:hypothetical protein